MGVILAPGAAGRAGAWLVAVCEDLGVPLRAMADADAAGASPGVLLLTPGDITGPHRETVRRVAEACSPGRPLLWGGLRDRDVLMDGINNWRVLRALPGDAGPALMKQALAACVDRLRLDQGLQHGVVRLERDNDALARRIAELRATRERLLHAARLESIGSMARKLADSCRGHLEAVAALSQLADVVADDEDLRLCLDYSLSAVATSREMFDSLANLGGGDERALEIEEAALDELVSRAAEFARFDKGLRSRTLQLELASEATVEVDTVALWRVLLNLLRNAVQATAPGDRITVRTYRCDDSVRVEVEDTGVGMTPEVLSHIFDPFFTTRGDGGTGIGLNVSRSAIAHFGGALSATSSPGQGSTFRVELPRKTKSA